MHPVKIAENIFWVGAIDWNLRNFHGYLTQRGTTYNAYLIIDEKITLIDTVKPTHYDEMMKRISNIIDPSKIDYIVTNHVEMDHSGSLPQLMKIAKNAKIIVSPHGERGLKEHYKEEWDMQTVKTGESLSIGNKKLEFILTPLVHWPDNMVTYLHEDKILFSNDAFGQHLASSERFDDEHSKSTIIEEAKKYYANIVLPYSSQVLKALDSVLKYDIKMIAPSHGLIWRSHLVSIVEKYTSWANNQTEKKALVIYDTMWGSTEKIAFTIREAFEHLNIRVKLIHLQRTHISDIMTDILNSKYICVGSPTLNSNMLPTVAAFLTYLRGLAPKGRIGMAFGSFGWGGQGIESVEQQLKDCKFEMLKYARTKYIPDEHFLQTLYNRIIEELENNECKS